MLYDDILKRIREELSDEERRRLVADVKQTMLSELPQSSIYESMSKRGLIGKLTTAPADLSTNPIHLEGFGKDAK